MYYIYLDNYNICINRVKSRFFYGGHNVPINDIIRGCKRSKNNFFKYKELVDEYRIYYNGNESIILVNDILKEMENG